MVDYDKYMLQALKIMLNNENSKNSGVTENDFEFLYKIYIGECEDFEGDVLQKIIDFVSQFLDWKFLDTPVGSVIGALKFRDDYMVTSEIAELMNVTIQYASKILPECKAVKKHNTYLVRESNFNEWLLKKKKPSLDQLKKERRKKTVNYETEKERLINPGFEGTEKYKV